MSTIDNSFKYRLQLITAYKDVLRNHCKPVFDRYCQHFRESQLEAARKLQGKEKIEVAFLLTIPGMWKLDYVFKQMQEDPRYHPYVVIYPYSYFKGFRKEEVDATILRTEKFVKEKGFEYVIPYNKEQKKWEDIQKTKHPDIVFFTTPYKDIPPQYFIYNFKNTLTCYVPYAFISVNMFKVDYDLIFHNLLGLNFVETELHLRDAQKYARNQGENTLISGYPGTEVFLRDDYTPKNVWKPQSKNKKKVIWAPHHTIDESTLNLSTFLLYCELMPKLAEKYKEEIQFVFKPHQLLKFKLQQIWGVEKTKDYYELWDNMENTQLEESSYVDLFLTSDAMMHDCGSFTTEYMFVNKPVMYLLRGDRNPLENFNEFGTMSFNNHYHGHNAEEIEQFLQSVIKGEDSMKVQRTEFFNNYLAPKDNMLPSAKIISLIEQTIQGKYLSND